jgi:hypothetical protein
MTTTAATLLVIWEASMRRLFTSLSVAALVVAAFHISGHPDGLKAAPGTNVQERVLPNNLEITYVNLRVPGNGNSDPILLDVEPAEAQIKLNWPDGKDTPEKASARFKFANSLTPGEHFEVATEELDRDHRMFPLSRDRLRLFAVAFLDEFKGRNLLTRGKPATEFVSSQILLTHAGPPEDVSASGPVRIVVVSAPTRPKPRVSSGAVQNVRIDTKQPAGSQIVAADANLGITIECNWLVRNASWLNSKLLIDFRLADGTPVGPLVFDQKNNEVSPTGGKLVVSKDTLLSKLNDAAKDLVAKNKLANGTTLTPKTMTIVPVDDRTGSRVEGELLPVDAPFKISVAANPSAGAVKPDASDIGKASQAAESIASAAAAAVERGETVDGVINAVNVIVAAYELTQNLVGAKAARAVASAAGSKAAHSTSSPQDVADAARTWADAIKAAEGQSIASKESDSTPTTDPRANLPKDLPPASAKVAFESALPIGSFPAMSAAGDYEYSLFVATPDRPEISEGLARQPTAKPMPPTPTDSPVPPPPERRQTQRRIGFFAVKYETPDKTWLAEYAARTAAWTGARAVQSQLVSLADPGLGYSVHIRKKESLVIGYCSFNDDGGNPRYDWFAFERAFLEPQYWNVYTVKPGHFGEPADTVKDSKSPTREELQAREDRVEEWWIEQFTDARMPLGFGAQSLGFHPPDPASLLHEHPAGKRPGPQGWPTIRVVVSGDVLTFSIEVGTKVYDSFHLAGEYRSDFFPPPVSGSRSALEERLQYGAVKVRSAATPSRLILDRAATYGADVLRRRGESLMGPNDLRKEYLGDNNHLVLFVRDSRTGQTSWLGLSSEAANGIQVTTKLSQPQGVQRRPLAYSLPSSPGLASPWTPKGEAAHSYPLFLGGEAGSRLVEVWIVQNQRTEDHFADSPTPLFDVQYLFLRPQ